MLRHFISRPNHRPSLDGSYRVRASAAPASPPVKPCVVTDCTQPAKSGCGGHCTRCWAERTARNQLY
jgi:hypothetical protein